MRRNKREVKCLVLYPEGLESYFADVYMPAIQKESGQAISLAKVLSTSSRIKKIEKILNQVQFVLADVTGRDKNVLFRAGLAHAHGKPVGIVAQSVEDIPSDLQHLGYAVYDTRKPDWVTTLQKDIAALMNEAMEEVI
jgi:2-phospho-L-lactate guanylyltransferase (CobY/MobA/RfbA family)